MGIVKFWQNVTAALFDGNPLVLFTFLTAAWVFVAFVSAAYLLAFVCVKVRGAALRRKQRKQERSRRLQFTLPDRENSFVRARLNTVLRVEDQTREESENTEASLRFSHAQKLLVKIKEAPLSAAERLEAEELTAFLGAYRKKDVFTARDVRLVNEAFSRVLKLSAKYVV